MLKYVAKMIRSNEGNLFIDFEFHVLKEYMKVKSYRQIAEDLGKSTKAVDNAMQRTKKKIITWLS